MSIQVLSAQMILAEHRYRPITGTIVTLGRNSVLLTGDDMDRLLVAMGVEKRLGVVYEVDQETMKRGRQRISQESFFAAFTDARVISLDVSDYEKADLICDIQDELPQEYVSVADFVYDGGSLDNIFDVSGSLKNLSRLLRPGGRFLASNNGGPHPTSYLKFSADWFMDFFAINRYADCKTYICVHPNTLGEPHLGRKQARPPRSPYEIIIYSFNPYVTHEHGEGYDCSSVESQCRYQIFVFAEKGRDSTDDRNPIQKHYRVDREHNRICNESAKRFLNSPRPVFSGPALFDPTTIPRIDSSDYPEQLRPVDVIPLPSKRVKDRGVGMTKAAMTAPVDAASASRSAAQIFADAITARDLGDIAGAVALLLRAQRLDPDSGEIRDELAQLVGNLDETLNNLQMQVDTFQRTMNSRRWLLRSLLRRLAEYPRDLKTRWKRA